MENLTKFELRLIEIALETQIEVYECYEKDPKLEKALQEYKNLLKKIKSLPI